MDIKLHFKSTAALKVLFLVGVFVALAFFARAKLTQAGSFTCYYNSGGPYTASCSDCGAETVGCVGTVSNCGVYDMGNGMCGMNCWCSSIEVSGSGLTSSGCDGVGGANCAFGGTACGWNYLGPGWFTSSIGPCAGGGDDGGGGGGGGGGVFDFRITLVPATQTINYGGVAIYNGTIERMSEYSGSVSLSLSGCPAGLPPISCGLTLTSVFMSVSDEMPAYFQVIVQNANVPGGGTFPLTVTGTSSSNITRNATVQLVINPPPTCGSANNQYFSSAPTTNLCSVGTASAVSGSGPWTWSCSASGMPTANCSANKTVTPACGSANGQTYVSAPTTNLCASGTASAVSGSGPWSWSCNGTPGTTPASCSANKTPNPACGAANNQAYTSAPTTNLCAYGTPSAVSGSGPWSWSCSTAGLPTANCQASVGACTINPTVSFSPASVQTNQQFYAYCNFGATICANAPTGCTWTGYLGRSGWSGTASEFSCTAPATAGPYSVTCAPCSGQPAYCSGSASITVNPPPVVGACGPAATSYPDTATNFSGALCNPGTASPASPGFPGPGGSVSWTCLGSNGGANSGTCTASRASPPPPPVVGACGPAATSYADTATSFSGALCNSGTASPANPTFPAAPGGSVSWTCLGSNGGANSGTCTASRADTPTSANLSVSEKDIVGVNYSALANAPYGRISGGTDPLPELGVTALKEGDVLSFSIMLRNEGDRDATNITLEDTLINLVEPDAGWNAKFNGVPLTEGGTGSGHFTVNAGNEYNQKMNFNLTGSSFNVPARGIRSLTFDAKLKADPSLGGSSPRLQNSFFGYYEDTPGHTATFFGTTPLIPFSRGPRSPGVIEIP